MSMLWGHRGQFKIYIYIYIYIFQFISYICKIVELLLYIIIHFTFLSVHIYIYGDRA